MNIHYRLALCRIADGTSEPYYSASPDIPLYSHFCVSWWWTVFSTTLCHTYFHILFTLMYNSFLSRRRRRRRLHFIPTALCPVFFPHFFHSAHNFPTNTTVEWIALGIALYLVTAATPNPHAAGQESPCLRQTYHLTRRPPLYIRRNSQYARHSAILTTLYIVCRFVVLGPTIANLFPLSLA